MIGRQKVLQKKMARLDHLAKDEAGTDQTQTGQRTGAKAISPQLSASAQLFKPAVVVTPGKDEDGQSNEPNGPPKEP